MTSSWTRSRCAIAAILAMGLLAAFAGCAVDDGEEALAPSAETPAASSEAAAGEVLPVLKDSWMYGAAADSSWLGPFEAGAAGDGWLAFFHNDLIGAQRNFKNACTPSEMPLDARKAKGYACIGLARTHLEMADFFAVVADLDRVTLRQFYRHRATHPEEVLASAHETFFSGLVELHSGDRAAGLERLRLYIGGSKAEPMLKALAERIVGGLDGGADPLVARVWGGAGEDVPEGADFQTLPKTADTAAYRARLDFMAAVAAGKVDAALGLIRPIQAQVADLLEELEAPEGSEAISAILHHHDPAYLWAFSRFHALRAVQAIGGAAELAVLTAQADRLLGRPVTLPDDLPPLPSSLPFILFSDLPNPQDFLAEERTHPTCSATLPRLSSSFDGLGGAPVKDLSALDSFVKRSNEVRASMAAAIKAAAPHGESMDSDIGLSKRFHGRILRERARQYQHNFSVRLDKELGADVANAGVAARSLLEMAMDKNPSPPSSLLKKARISFRNDPPQLAELARAQLDTRRPYDANEYIRPLTEVYSELILVREALAGLDSAWNPARRGSVR